MIAADMSVNVVGDKCGVLEVDPLIETNKGGKQEIVDAPGGGKTPAEDTDTDEGLGGRTRTSKPRKMKPRRARKKTYKPYYQLSETERRLREERERLRELKQRERMMAKGRITAPYNTTQFLMSDAKADNILEQLQEKLEARGLGRSRHESFSTEEDIYYSSQDDNEVFISNQFNVDYQMQQLNRLELMSKELLLNEYMLLERKNETLEEKLEFMRGQEEEKAKRGLVDYDFEKGEVPMDPETFEKINIFQQEIERLQIENVRLHAENSKIKERLQAQQDIKIPSAASLSSSSSSSSSSSESSEDEGGEEEKVKIGVGPPEDTGYESTHSKDSTLSPIL